MKRALFLLGFALLLSTVSSSAALKFDRVGNAVFSSPVFMVAPPGDTKRLFVGEQKTGRIRILYLETGRIETNTTFMTVSGMLSSGSEQGLLGMAFDPNYQENGYFYLNYTAPLGGPAGHTEIARFQVSGDPATSRTASMQTKKVLLTFGQPQSNHNGGWLGFGPDGYLYISSGDGGGGNDPFGTIGNGQNRSALLGKILRIDVHRPEPPLREYGIPEGNPFKGHETFREEIWAFGLRNPWRCSFDRLTGDLWIGDVGQGTREEVSVAPRGVGGLNFGWRVREGKIQNPAFPNEQTVTPYTNPVFDYDNDSVGISVTGGYVYRGRMVPEASGKYFFSDYGSARFWMTTWEGETNGTTVEVTAQLNPNRTRITNPSSFGEDGNGELYVCSISGSTSGQIFRLGTTTPPPMLTAQRTEEEDQVVLSFNANSGQAYLLEGRTDLFSGEWVELQSIPAPQSSTTISVTNQMTEAQQFFRVRSAP